MPVVRTFDSGEATFGRYRSALDAYRDVLVAWYRAASFTARFSLAVLGPLPTLGALLAVGLVLFPNGGLNFPTWLATLLLGTGMAEALMPLMMLNHMVEKAKQSVARIVQVLDLPELSVSPEAQSCPRDASVTFEHVYFRYGAGDTDALHDVSFRAQPGTVTALVGASGAGKSTVVRLIPRFWDVSAGRILVGGEDVRRLDPDLLMSHVAFVFQDPFLLAGTVAANIRLGQPGASQEAVIAAARAAQAHDFIMALPQGYETRLGESGGRLSGGQRQRIAIARAVLADRPILVLDEATAFADAEGEAALIAGLSALMRGRTVILVAHRLTTIRDADQILVFDRGRLAERGDHAGLVARGGLYAQLCAHDGQSAHWALRASRRDHATS
jgi:ATP-binding cassette subfamily B protein